MKISNGAVEHSIISCLFLRTMGNIYFLQQSIILLPINGSHKIIVEFSSHETFTTTSYLLEGENKNSDQSDRVDVIVITFTLLVFDTDRKIKKSLILGYK